MQQGVWSPEERKVRERRPETDRNDLSAVEAPEKEHHFHGKPSAGFIGATYERFLEMPVPVVLAALWLAGAALLGSCALTLYVLVMWLVGT
jgi:hypothetical protein